MFVFVFFSWDRVSWCWYIPACPFHDLSAHCDFCFWNVNGQVWHEVSERSPHEEPIRQQSWSWLDPQQCSGAEELGRILIWERGAISNLVKGSWKESGTLGNSAQQQQAFPFGPQAVAGKSSHFAGLRGISHYNGEKQRSATAKEIKAISLQPGPC